MKKGPSAGFLFFLLIITGACAPKTYLRPDHVSPVQEIIGERAPFIARLSKTEISDERLLAPLTLGRFYTLRSNRPAWLDEKGLTSRVDDLLAVLRQADQEGLNPDEYHLKKLERMRHECKKHPRLVEERPDEAANFDLLLTDAFLIYACHLLAGRTDIDMTSAQWKAVHRKADLIKTLEAALQSGQVASTLAGLAPAHADYRNLRAALMRLRRIPKEEWAFIPEGPALKIGDSGSRVEALRRRLIADGYTGLKKGKPDVYTSSVKWAVGDFQKRVGFKPDGSVGPQTRAALNVSLEERIHQIKFNMDRWRWLPVDLGSRYVFVNIPDYMLYAVEGGSTVLSMPVIVGSTQAGSMTPIFSDKMTYLEFSPQWNVTRDIATKELLPKIQDDPTFLERNQYEVLRGNEIEPEVLDAAKVDWCSLSVKNFPYRIRQKSGRDNSLGSVKFMFPNQFNIYIHATPVSHLFSRRERMFSHGCVRVKDPLDLAVFVLQDPEWTPEKIKKATRLTEPHLVPLIEPVPVYLLYWTAWVDSKERLHFRRDIYDYDLQLKEKFYSPKPRL